MSYRYVFGPLIDLVAVDPGPVGKADVLPTVEWDPATGVLTLANPAVDAETQVLASEARLYAIPEGSEYLDALSADELVASPLAVSTVPLSPDPAGSPPVEVPLPERAPGVRHVGRLVYGFAA